MSFAPKSRQLHTRFIALMDEIGCVAEAADRLGLNRNTAYGWARRAGLRTHRLGHQRRPEYEELRNLGLTRRGVATSALPPPEVLVSHAKAALGA